MQNPFKQKDKPTGCPGVCPLSQPELLDTKKCTELITIVARESLRFSAKEILNGIPEDVRQPIIDRILWWVGELAPSICPICQTPIEPLSSPLTWEEFVNLSEKRQNGELTKDRWVENCFCESTPPPTHPSSKEVIEELRERNREALEKELKRKKVA